MKKLLPLFLATTAVLAHSAFGQTATTTPVGAMTYSFPATTAVTNTVISFPLIATPVFAGKISNLTANTITATSAGWTAGMFSTASQPYFVRFTTGNQVGRTIKITGNTVDTLTLDNTDNSTQTTALDLSGWAVVAGSAGDGFEIIAGDTLASMFGDGTIDNPLLFVGHPVISLADIVSVYNKSTSLWEAYYFNTSAGAWRKKGSAISENNTVLFPDASVMITRRANRPATQNLSLLGSVPITAPLSKTTGAQSTVYISTRFPVDTTLSQLNLIGWASHDVISLADRLSIYDPTTSLWEVFYRHATSGQWRKKGSTIDYSNLVIPAGKAIGITKRSSVSGSASFLKSTALPYSL